ncbi:hypothetical protein Taro_001172 [Colocasia esculenta]|uniref:Uncharacterized protein n=1 Tax=Colocasia esculenta TaxID=4460 RepID=A0A843THD3_COLES|nr:hypothetical protein [Colocasia esculenta]
MDENPRVPVARRYRRFDWRPASEYEDDYGANREQDQDIRNARLEAPSFDGSVEPQVYLDWEARVDRYFDWMGIGALPQDFLRACPRTLWPALVLFPLRGLPLLSLHSPLLLVPFLEHPLHHIAVCCLNHGLMKTDSCRHDGLHSQQGRVQVRAAIEKLACAMEDYGSGTMECFGSGAAPLASPAEFTLDGSDEKDFYDVSLVDEYNLPMCWNIYC